MGVIWQKAPEGKLRLASTFSIWIEKATVIIPVPFGTQPWKGINVLLSLTGQQTPALPSLCPAQFFLLQSCSWDPNPCRGGKTGHCFFSPDSGSISEHGPACSAIHNLWLHHTRLLEVGEETEPPVLLIHQCLNSCPGLVWGLCAKIIIILVPVPRKM